jgi:sulfate permease, SulP family
MLTAASRAADTLLASLWSFRGDRKGWLRADLVAGLTTGAVVIPKAVAYATVAGLPPAVGLYTAFVPMAIYALLGTSRTLSVSSTTTIAILSATALGAVAPPGDAESMIAASATLAFLIGSLLILAAVLRLGFMANFISEPVLVGFKTGIGLVILVDQFPKLLGVHMHKEGFLRDVGALLQQLPQTSWPTLTLSILVFVLIACMERRMPKVPAPLLAIAMAIGASTLLDLPAVGVETVGQVPSGLPGWTSLRPDLIQALWPAASGIALMSFTESIAAARAFKRSDEPAPIPNRELLAVALANLGGSVLGAMPAGGGASQTAVNRRAGARSQIAALVTASLACATMVALAQLIAQLPQAALAAVVIAYSIELIQPREFLAIVRVRAVEFRWALIAFGGVLMLGTLQGILTAVIASLLSLVYQAYNPPVYPLGRKRGSSVFRALSEEHADDETWPGLLILRTEGRVFFANAQGVGERMMQLIEQHRPCVVVVDCSAILDIEYTALKLLIESERRMGERGIALWLAAMNAETRTIVAKSSLSERLGPARAFLSLQTAVEAYQAAFDAAPTRDRRCVLGEDAT